MEFKGTKGKWVKSKNIFNEDNVKSEHGFSVCKITGMDIDEMNYNQQLIIHAPELLRALQNMLLSVKQGYTSFADIDNAESVINKALNL